MLATKLVEERDSEYGSAWRLHGEVSRPIAMQLHQLLRVNPWAYFPWVLILNKLIRALTTPYNLDHWRDIQGYAELVIQHIETMEDQNGKVRKS